MTKSEKHCVFYYKKDGWTAEEDGLRPDLKITLTNKPIASDIDIEYPTDFGYASCKIELEDLFCLMPVPIDVIESIWSAKIRSGKLGEFFEKIKYLTQNFAAQSDLELQEALKDLWWFMVDNINGKVELPTLGNAGKMFYLAGQVAQPDFDKEDSVPIESLRAMVEVLTKLVSLVE